MDRSNVGNAKVAGMDKALQMTVHDYYLVIIVFQVAYVVGGPISRFVHVRVCIPDQQLNFA